MRNSTSAFAVIIVGLLAAIPLPSPAQLYLNIGAPPLLPSYTQPPVSVQNEIWIPGYWAWGQSGYYWVPGTWALPPSPGLLYTPGYWNAAQTGYQWNAPYWAQNVGYYGGVNYGSGYYGNGYTGGNWAGQTFRYNTAVTRVNTTIIRNVYVNRVVVVRTINRVSYNGGRGGLTARPTPAQLIVVHERHLPITVVQRRHIVEASTNRTLLATVNHGRPPVVVIARPLSATNRAPGYKAVTSADHHAAPVPVVHHVAPAAAHHAAPAPVHHAAQPAAHHPAPKPAGAHPEGKPQGEHAEGKPPK